MANGTTLWQIKITKELAAVTLFGAHAFTYFYDGVFISNARDPYKLSILKTIFNQRLFIIQNKGGEKEKEDAGLG